MADSGLCILLFLEQLRASGPSDSATLYCLASIIIDTIFIWKPLDASYAPEPRRIVLIRCLAHTCLLALELRTKSPAYDRDGVRLSPEERHGILNKVVFAWINPVLAQGYSRILSEEDMPVLSQDIKPEHYRKLMIRLWSQRGKLENPPKPPVSGSDPARQTGNQVHSAVGLASLREEAVSCGYRATRILDSVPILPTLPDKGDYQICGCLPGRCRGGPRLLARSCSYCDLCWPCSEECSPSGPFSMMLR